MIDPTLITTRLRLDLEGLFQVNNQAFYLGRLHPTAAPLTLAMGNRLHCVINDLLEVIGEIDPPKHDMSLLNAEEIAIMGNYASLKQGMVKSYLWIESREAEILRQAAIRIADSGGPQGL